jgi:hypothetical protein
MAKRVNRGIVTAGTLWLGLLGCVTASSAIAEIAVPNGSEFGLDLPEARQDLVDDAPLDAPSFQQTPTGGIVLRGNGRFGLLYQDEGLGGRDADVSVNSRLRLDVDISTKTDGGVTFGGRIRAQASSGEPTGIGPAKLYATWD